MRSGTNFLGEQVSEKNNLRKINLTDSSTKLASAVIGFSDFVKTKQFHSHLKSQLFLLHVQVVPPLEDVVVSVVEVVGTHKLIQEPPQGGIISGKPHHINA